MENLCSFLFSLANVARMVHSGVSVYVMLMHSVFSLKTHKFRIYFVHIFFRSYQVFVIWWNWCRRTSKRLTEFHIEHCTFAPGVANVPQSCAAMEINVIFCSTSAQIYAGRTLILSLIIWISLIRFVVNNLCGILNICEPNNSKWFTSQTTAKLRSPHPFSINIRSAHKAVSYSNGCVLW